MKQPSVTAAARAAWRAALLRPHVVALLVTLNLVTAWMLASPLRGLLSSTLDHSLYGEAMASGASWRWFDTVSRTDASAFGDLDAWKALFSDGGMRWKNLKSLAGPPAQIALAGLLFYWLSAVLHCGFLASLTPDRRGGFAAASARYALPVSAFAFFALLTYAAVYWLVFVQTGKWLEDWSTAVDSEWAALAALWLRLGLTLAGLLAVKLLFDLAKVVLVERDTWNWPWSFLLAVKELGSRGRLYVGVYLLIGLALPALAALWSVTGARLVAGGWVTLALAFVLQQTFVALLTLVRLAHLAGSRALYLEALALKEAEKPPYKVEPEAP